MIEIKNYIVQFQNPLLGWHGIKRCKTLKEAINYIEESEYKPKNYRVIKLVAEYKEKHELHIHGEKI